jgi:transposase
MARKHTDIAAGLDLRPSGNGDRGGVRLEQLPPYAPALNPWEGVWNQLKNVEMRNLCCLNLVHLRCELDLAIKRLRRKPHVITACFAEAAGYP